MKLIGAVAVLVAGAGAWAGEVVTVCLNPGANAVALGRGEGVAAQLLKQAGVRIEWRGDERVCATAERGMVVSVSLATPAEAHPGALAYAMTYERTRIVLFYDRVQNAVRPDVAPFLVGHVLAHEIGHMLQGVSQHAESGIMKARWDSKDYADVQRGGLGFTEEDVRLIQRNWDRSSRPVIDGSAAAKLFRELK